MHKDLKEVKRLTKFTNREELGKGLSQKLGLMLEEQPGGWSGWRGDRTWELRPHRMEGAETTGEDNARRVSKITSGLAGHREDFGFYFK